MPEDPNALWADHDWWRKQPAAQPELPARTLTGRRGRWAAYLLVLLILVAAGASLGSVLGWLCAAFFGLCLVVAALHLLHPGRLVLSVTGFDYRSPVRRPVRYEWSDCGPFALWWGQWNHQIVFATDRPGKGVLRRANRALTGGADGYLQPYFKGISNDELVELMNRYRDQALGRAGTVG